jgi:hypothetical protein
VRLRREAKILQTKALTSLRSAISRFNDPQDEGRVTEVLMAAQHAFEMLLKAALVQKKMPVFDKRSNVSISFDKCLNICRQHLAVDALRDAEQHWFIHVSEGLLYTYMRASVTLFDDLMRRAFGSRLADHLPVRVLPISTEPPRDIQLLIDEQYAQIKQLLAPGRRQSAEARAGIRALLAMEAHESADESLIISEADVTKVEKAAKADQARSKVFPRLSDLGVETTGDGLSVTLRFIKNADAPTVRYAADGEDATAFRDRDLQGKYHWDRTRLAAQLDLTIPKCAALREHLGTDDDPEYHHVWQFGKSEHHGYSDKALRDMRAALKSIDIEAVWRERRARQRRVTSGAA